MTIADELDLRPMAPTDRNFVLSSWSRSFAGRSNEARDYENLEDWYDDYTPVVNALVDRSRVVIACLKERPDVIVGWMAFEGDVLHYVLVKPKWRLLGVARWMLAGFAEMPVTYTHRTIWYLFEDSIESSEGHGRVPHDWVGAVIAPKVPKHWKYRRWLVWPQGEKAA